MADERVFDRRDFIRVAAVTALGLATACADGGSVEEPGQSTSDGQESGGESGTETGADSGVETDPGSDIEADPETDPETDPGADVDSETDEPDQCDLTSSDIEGPFYRDNPPNRAVLVEPGEPGRPLQIIGTVYASDCVTPLVGAVVDVWHADDAGEYDNTSDAFRMRGQMKTDEGGAYVYDTIRPGRYPNGGTFRPEHIHYKVSYKTADSDEVTLTTQLYFEDDPFLEGDPWAVPARTIPLSEESENSFVRRFDVVLPVDPV